MTPVLRIVSAALCAGTLAACAVAPALHAPRASMGRLVTAEQIRQSGAQTAWQVLERRPGLLRIGTTAGGLATASSRRAGPYTGLRGEPLLVVDGVRMTSLEVLRQIPAESVRSIEFLDGVNAPMYSGSANGVLVVRTAPPTLP